MVVAACLAAFSLPALLAQQPTGAAPQQPPVPAEGTAAISGVVTDATTNQPIPGVMVYLGFQGRGAVGRLSRQISDGKGRFVFTDLPAGDLYFINASKFGYLEGHFGVGAGGLLGGLMRVTDGQWFAEANVTMQRPGSISGRIVDERGDPAVGAFVRVLARIKVGRQLRLSAGPVTKTDDRGMYHIAQLPPGRYLVQVPQVQASLAGSITAQDLSGVTAEQIAAGRTVPDPPVSLTLADGTRLIVGGYLPPPPPVNGRPYTYPPVFHPGVTSITSAGSIDLRAGEDRPGINIALRSVPATSISGRRRRAGGLIAGTHIRLLADGLEGMGNGSEVATATVGSEGRFSLRQHPGRFVHDRRSPDRHGVPVSSVDRCHVAVAALSTRPHGCRWWWHHGNSGGTVRNVGRLPQLRVERSSVRATESHRRHATAHRPRRHVETRRHDSRPNGDGER
jgi:hypothetical protein